MQMWECALYVLAVVPHCTVVTPASFTGAAFEVAPWQCIYFCLLSTGRCQLYSWCAITLMSVSACRAHHVDTWPWNESIITPGKCFCLFIFSHLRYSVLGCSQVAPSSYANALRGSLSLSLHLPRSFSPSLSHGHTCRLPALFVAIIVRAGQERVKEIERKNLSVDRLESRIKVKQIDASETLGARTQGYDILYHHCLRRQCHQRCLHQREFYITSKWREVSDIPRLSQIVLSTVWVGISLSRAGFTWRWIGMFKWWLGMPSNRPWVSYNRHKAEQRGARIGGGKR